MDKRIDVDKFNALVRERDAQTDVHLRYALKALIEWWAPVPYTIGGAVSAAREEAE